MSETIETQMQNDEPQNIITILSDLQAKIKTLEADNAAQLKELNQFRLGLFIPRHVDQFDINPIAARVTYNILTILKEDGLEAAQNHKKLQLELFTRLSDIVEQARHADPISIRIDKEDKVKKEKVAKIRKETSPEARKEKVLLTTAEKAINQIRKQYKNLSLDQLVPFVHAFRPDLTQDEVKAHLESIFAKEAQAKLKA